MKKIAVILSGCGVYDGAEIHEAVLSLLAIKKNGAEYEIFAPDIVQHHVINHFTGDTMPETRNVLVESARIARGKIKPLKSFSAKDFDAIMLPGGFGAAKNLSDFAFKGDKCTVNKEVEDAIRNMHRLGKPIAAMCIAPVILAKVLGDVELTIGQDLQTAQAIENMGATHKTTSKGDVVVDIRNNIFTTPCYMLESSITDIAQGTDILVKSVLSVIN